MTTPHNKNTNAPDHGSGQFGQLGETGKGTDLTEQMDSAGPQTDDHGQAVELIPWNPVGKIDDEVERRTWPTGQAPSQPGDTAAGDVHSGAVKGGTHQGQEDTGPGRYGGPTAQTMANQRYAGASDNAPTDPVAGATTTLAASAAQEESDHTMRPPGAEGQHQTWEGGTASDQAMHAPQEFEHAGHVGHSAPPAPAATHAPPAAAAGGHSTPPAPGAGHPTAASSATGGQSSTTGQHSGTAGSTHTPPQGGSHSTPTTPQHGGSGHGDSH